jgi:hypothetical protein
MLERAKGSKGALRGLLKGTEKVLVKFARGRGLSRGLSRGLGIQITLVMGTKGSAGTVGRWVIKPPSAVNV